MKVGVGLVGLGGVGGWGHLPGYVESPQIARLVGVCDNDPGVLARVGAQTDAVRYTDYYEMIKNGDIDAVDICLPHHLHAETALAAIKAGKHVIVEKPFTNTLQEADAVKVEAKKARVKLMVAENTRFVNAYQVVRRMIDLGMIGTISFARTYIGGNGNALPRTPDNWRDVPEKSGGGSIFDAGVHSFYLLEWMVGRISSIHAVSQRFREWRPEGMEDTASGTVRFEGGAIGHWDLAMTAQIPWTERLEIFGTKGSVIADMLSERPVQLFSTAAGGEAKADWWGIHDEYSRAERILGNASWTEPYVMHSAVDWKAQSMIKGVRHFLKCIIEDGDPLVDAEAGRRCVQIALAAYESIKGKEEVPVL